MNTKRGMEKLWYTTSDDIYQRRVNRITKALLLYAMPEWQTARAVQFLLAVSVVNAIATLAIFVALVMR